MASIAAFAFTSPELNACPRAATCSTSLAITSALGGT
jgi:hypothetical protein